MRFERLSLVNQIQKRTFINVLTSLERITDSERTFLLRWNELDSVTDVLHVLTSLEPIRFSNGHFESSSLERIRFSNGHLERSFFVGANHRFSNGRFEPFFLR